MTNPHIETLVNFLRDFADANADSFTPEQIEHLNRASVEIAVLDRAVDNLIKERYDARREIELLRTQLAAKTDELDLTINDLQEVAVERDSARWEVCELSGNGSIDSAMRVAEERGWIPNEAWNHAEEDSDAEESH